MKKFLIPLLLLVFSCSREDKGSAQAPTAEKNAAAAQSTSPKNSTHKTEGADSSFLTEFFGSKLVDSQGNRVAVDRLKGKEKIGLYFSAHWCPPCKFFTPRLVRFYREVTSKGKAFEIVFVSADRSEAEMERYMSSEKMPWLAVPFNSPKKDFLAEKFGVRFIPRLIILDKNGKVLAEDARGDVERYGVGAYDRW